MMSVLVFDFDGVLIESVSAKAEAFKQLFVMFGQDVADEAHAYHCQNPGVYRRDKIRDFYSKHLGKTLTRNEINKELGRLSNAIIDRVSRSPLVSGVREFFEGEVPYPCYIASSAPQDEVRWMIRDRNLTKFFVKVYGGPTKKPDILRRILTIEQCLPQNIIFIGDSVSDYKAARDVGTRFIYRRSNVTQGQILQSKVAIGDLREISSILYGV